MKRTIKIMACIALLLVLQLPMAASAQVKWHSIEEGAAANIGTKLYLVDFYTSWCGYCKKMDRETFSDPTVAKILNRYYYPVKFNAEGNNTFTWHGTTYRPATNGRNRAHEFAKGVRGYPTFGIYRADGSLLQAVPGYYPAKDFVIVLWYFASGDYTRYTYERYLQIFDKEIRPTMEKALEQ